MAGKPCPKDCTCGRHKRPKSSYRSGSTPCPKGCPCGRHKRVISEEHRQNIVMANKARKGERRSCPDDCTCKKHKAYYRGGSKVGRKFSEEARRNIAEGARKRVYSSTKKYKPQRVSKAEYMLAPYLTVLGFTHNDKRTLSVGRKWPDFYDTNRQRIFEYFGNFHHPDHEQEEIIIDFYRQRGWSCVVLWESDVFSWLELHRGLVTEEQHQKTIETAYKIIPFQFRPRRSK